MQGNDGANNINDSKDKNKKNDKKGAAAGKKNDSKKKDGGCNNQWIYTIFNSQLLLMAIIINKCQTKTPHLLNL